MRSSITSVLALAMACSVQAQFQGPESVEYDAAYDRYLVSNTQSSSIKALSQTGVVTNFASGIPNAPYGLEIMGDVVYACAGSGVRGYSLANGAEVYYRDLGAIFPNGITTDGEFLYITDFSSSARRIYKVDPVNDSHSTLVSNTGGQPNGIVWDSSGERLVTVFWGSNAPIRAFDRNTGEATVLVANSGVGNIDGITMDCDGNFLIASWSPARITRFEPTFTQAGVNLNVPGLNNPADIDFDPVNVRVCIPNSGNNTVTLFDHTCLSSGISVAQPSGAMRVSPNPTADRVRPEPPLERPEPYVLLDGQGLLVGGGTLRPNAEIDLSALPAGVYIIHLVQADRRFRVVRE